jgi:tetratricopeptide (TPR) repeat protein
VITADATPAPSSRPQEILRRLGGAGGASPLVALGNVTTEPTEIEDFRPLSECLEWRLADVYWHQAGVVPFVRNDVPYLVNNTGRLSDSAAALAFAAFDELGSALPERISLLELGAGTGLYARYFLDAFSALCRDAGRDFYERLTYVVTDRFERTVTDWQRTGLFADHEGHVMLGMCDASAPGEVSLPGGATETLDAPLVVFCNYLLDVLPSTITQRSETGFKQLCVRTHLAGGAVKLKLAGIASLEDARALAASGRFDDLARLLPLLPQLDLEIAFRPWVPTAGSEQALASAISGKDRVIVNGGALDCLRKILDLLHESGFVLVNDYGPVRLEDVAGHMGVQRFGGSVALGVNFPLLEQVLVTQRFTVLAPDGDPERRVHTRLIARRAGQKAREVLQSRFGLENDRYLDAPLEEARGHVAAGRTSEAVAAYRTLIERNPRDWQMLGETAEYVGLQLRDYAAGFQIARAALERNPWCSAWLWNVLGDCFFYKEKLDEAHEAFLQAQRIDPDDPRTNLNLAYTFAASGAMDEALGAIARGLAQDGRARGAYRARLLEKQAQILVNLAERASADQERLFRRSQRFR